MAATRIALVDARAADRFGGRNETIDPVAGHVPGALNHPFTQNLDERQRWLAPAILRQRWQAVLAAAGERPIVAMCGSGITACHNLLALELAGVSGARLYAGSWSEWILDPARPIATGEENA
jgi:thiosulfate/3-mercaptopyruvate sulfurtransferase